MTGMQTARLKAESQGRKAKVRMGDYLCAVYFWGNSSTNDMFRRTATNPFCVTACQLIP